MIKVKELAWYLRSRSRREAEAWPARGSAFLFVCSSILENRGELIGALGAIVSSTGSCFVCGGCEWRRGEKRFAGGLTALIEDRFTLFFRLQPAKEQGCCERSRDLREDKTGDVEGFFVGGWDRERDSHQSAS